MQPTVYQKPEIRDANDNIIQQGAFGKNTALANATNDGWIDYVANDLEFLYDLAKDEVVPVPSLPASGQTNKTYLLTTTGVSYRWSGTEWVAVSSSEAVGRAESAANLAEQWATKTDGSVDGTEYSAKYYAGLAEASADDAQDVADDMADHLVQIDKNTGGVSKNSKRISNIEKLLQGNLYDYDTDDDVAYTKTVPSGALPYAGIETLGGRTVVMNQLVQNGSFADGTTGWNVGSATTSVSNNVLTLTLTTSTYIQLQLTMNNYVHAQVGHKYYISAVISNSSGKAIFVPTTGAAAGRYDVNDITSAKRSGFIYTAQGSTDLPLQIRYSATTSGVSEDLTATITNYMCVDLTLMFGSGNEPSTVAEFEAMFPADYYPYNAGTLLSAGVTEVESVGKNLIDYSGGKGVPSNTAVSNTTKRIFPIGKYIVGIHTDNYYNESIITAYSVTENSITLTASNSGYGVGIVFDCVAGESYTLSYVGGSSGGTTSTAMWYAEDGTYLSHTTGVVSSTTLVAPANAYQCVLVLRTSTNTSTTYSNIQIEAGATATAYSKPLTATMPIPAEVQALDGYGWSAGSVYNEIDFENKKFIQRVGSVDLGSLSYTLSTSGLYMAEFPSAKGVPNTVVKANMVCPIYNLVVSSTITGPDGATPSPDKDYALGAGKKLYINNLTYYHDVPAFTTAMSGVYLYYELATPVETDISAYLTDDNLIEVGAGGTLTFPNQNGADYHIPVPSTETYMIDLQEAISNG